MFQCALWHKARGGTTSTISTINEGDFATKSEGFHAMLTLPESVALPLKEDEGGNIRVSGTRVTLHTLISSYL